MDKLQKVQVKFSSITLNLEEIADYINELLAEVHKLQTENAELKKKLQEQDKKE